MNKAQLSDILDPMQVEKFLAERYGSALASDMIAATVVTEKDKITLVTVRLLIKPDKIGGTST